MQRFVYPSHVKGNESAKRAGFLPLDSPVTRDPRRVIIGSLRLLGWARMVEG